MKKVLSTFLVLMMSMTMWGATSSVPDNAPDVMLQAFYWDSYPSNSGNLGYGNTGWSALLSQADELGEYFDLVWLPPCSQSSGGTGYIPKQYSNLNSDWGSESQLRELISKLKAKNTRAVADIVVNHVTGNYGWCSFATMDFGSYGKFNPQASWICKTDEMNYDSGAGSCKGQATGANDDGYGDEANYSAARDWDHKNSQVQAMCRAYLKWLKNDVGFDGWRYDYGKGFHHSHINDYNSAAGAYMSVVEYWDGNPGVIRSRLEDAQWNNMAFDFGTKYDALNNGICSFDYSKCKGAGMLGAGLKKHAVTFVDNHDTFQRNSSEFGGQGNSMLSNLKDRLLQANAFILSMPGIPCVFYPHWVTYKSELKKMIEARHYVGVHSQSEVKDEYAEEGGYQATIVGSKGYLILQLGNKVGGSFDGFTKYASGNGYAMWISSSAIPADPNAPKFYITGNDALVGDKAWTADAIAVKDNSYTFENLAADKDYQLKITIDGTWGTAKGFNDLTTTADGLSGDNDGNICFSLSEAGDVKVTYTGSVFKLEGEFATSGSGSGEEPQPTTKFYITGNDALVGDKAWKADAIASTEDSYTFENLATGKDYKMKITTDGTWSTAKGYSDLTSKADGLSDDSDGNICFSLSEAGDVKVTYTGSVFKVEGKFVTEGSGSGNDPQAVDSVTVYFVNTLNWTKVNVYVWDAKENAYKQWPGGAAAKEADKVNGNEVYSYTFPKTFVNIIFNNGTVQTGNLKWDTTKPYFVPSEKDGEGKYQGTWYAKDGVPASGSGSGGEQTTAKFYITGNDALVGDKAWNPAAIASTEDSYTIENLATGKDYKMKITTDGTWGTAKGYSDLTSKANGLSDDSDGNICFSLSEAGDVNVTYTGSVFKVEGKFVTEGSGSGDDQPVDSVTVYFVNTLNWTKVNVYVWDAKENAYKQWPGGAAAKEADKVNGNEVYSYTFPKTFVNIIFNNGTVQTVNLKWDTTKPYFVPSDKDGEGKYQGTWYAKDGVPASGSGSGDEPQPTVKFYITGNDELVGEKAWQADAIAVTEDSYTFENLAAEKDYKMKITIDGTWSSDKGYDDLTDPADGLSTDASGNICFSLSEEGNVKVTYTSSVFKVEGNFFLKPVEIEETETLQLVPGVWGKDGAKIAAWTWSKGLDGKWTAFFEPKADNNDTLKADIRAKADSILFIRFKAEATKPTWDGGDGYIWNRLENDTIDHNGLTYTITDWAKGQWTEATATPDDPEQGEEPEEPEQPEETETLQLIPGVWTADGAKIAAWTWSKDLSGKWTAFFEPKADDNDTLKADIRVKADSILFVRFNAEATEPTWDKEAINVWNKLANDTIDHIGLTYTITGWAQGRWKEAETTPEDPGQTDEPIDSVTVYFVNNLNWTAVKAYAWDENEKANTDWPGAAMKKEAEKLQGYDVYSYKFPENYVNIIFNDGTTQTADLQWNADKPYFFPTDKDGNGKYSSDWYTKADVPAAVVPAKFYITGDSALVVDAGADLDKKWNPAAIKSVKDTFELSLKANQYYVLKVTLNGTWEGENNVKGYNELTEKADGLVDDSDDHNIGFKLTEAGKVQVIYTIKDNKTIFKLAGKFATEGSGSGDDPATVEDGYYLMGTMNGWVSDAAYLFTANSAAAGEYYLDVTLDAGDKLKVAKVEGGVAKIWYPDGMDNDYTVDAAHAGGVTVYFRPNGNDDWQSFHEGGYFYITQSTATDIDSVATAEQATKLFRDGQLFILRGAHIYTVQGQLVR